MNVQATIWTVTLACIAAISLIFLYVVAKAGKEGDAALIGRTANRVRPWWFGALVVFIAVMTWATLVPFPIPAQNAALKADQVVDIVGHQWYWDISKTKFKKGSTIEFRVTSADVNHGFAIYAPNNLIVAQTQAMPGYTNKLLHTFDEPGTYRLLCLEFCGVAHHVMEAEFEVGSTAAGDGS
ncbi:MAG: cytochrome oxidase [Acetobacteraceae bacterium]|nr:cytochrome oxidase [Acetobacteraceae bacterium]